ncbi:Wzz/FepE/Etk N-terminal domain-containing protein [Fictibacillus sp. JL2B1089]|uniref:Wzz/FepE/Etk N-terminal domain-containing protein n=1 Tax=Fictibacillus sp. JL2B1089 TaxID=3399565 RepID=UPI003A83A56B
MHDEKRFVLYDYLVFFWNKKLWFLLLPLITLGLAFLISMMQPVQYQGRTILYTGDLKGSETDPEVIKHQYKNDVKDNNLAVEVFERGQLVFTVTGSNSAQVNNDISSITKKHYKVLDEEYEEIILRTENGMETKEQHLDSLNKLTALYTKQMKEDTLSPEEESRMTELQIVAKEIEQQIDNNKKDIAMYEKPQKLDTTVVESGRNQKPILALGLVAGLFLSLISLVLWKYIEDARRYRKND